MEIKSNLTSSDLYLLRNCIPDIQDNVSCEDLLKILPKKINNHNLVYRPLPGEEQWVAYYDGDMEYESAQVCETLIDSLFELVIFLYESKYLK